MFCAPGTWLRGSWPTLDLNIGRTHFIYGKAPKVTNGHRTLAILLAVGGLLVFSVPLASAHRGRVFGPSFGSPGSGAGELSLVFFVQGGTGKTIGGSGLAVDESTHDVYVADTGNRRVDEFASAGAFVRAWGWGVEDGASEFQICTGATGCRAGLSGTSPGEFEAPGSSLSTTLPVVKAMSMSPTTTGNPAVVSCRSSPLKAP